MIKNYLVDSELSCAEHTWVFDRCSKMARSDNLSLMSTDDTYGIHQTLFLEKPGRYYFRVNVSALKLVKEVVIGVEIDGVLKATKTYVPLSYSRSISVIVDINDVNKPATLYVISVKKIGCSSIRIKEPVLYRLDDLWLKFALKFMLDVILPYKPSLTYDNLLPTARLNLKSLEYVDNKNTSVIQLNPFEILVSTTGSINIQRKCVLKQDHMYLLKILIEDVNSQGSSLLYYKDTPGKCLSKYQQYIEFVFDGSNKPYIKCVAKEGTKLPYRIILKKILLLDITERQFEESEIKSLLYVE